MPTTKPTLLYYEAIEDNKIITVDLTEDQETKRKQHREIINAMDNYYDPHRERWRQNGVLFNVIQTGTNDPVANWYLGWSRIIISHSVAMTNAGEPSGAFNPLGPSDDRLRVLWDALVKHYLNKCRWPSQQRRWSSDLHITGNGVIKAYTEVKMRKEGTVWVRDRKRSKTGLRAKSPFMCMRSTGIADPDDVDVGVERDNMVWNNFVTKFANVQISDGKTLRFKYDTSQVTPGWNVQLTHVYDEDANEYTIYCLTYGSKPNENLGVQPGSLPVSNNRELGVPIYHVRMRKRDLKDSKDEGLNIQGMAPLAFAMFEDQLDIDYETHATVGMGIPQFIEGPETAIQQLVMQTLDNLELKNTVPISYEPFDPENPSYLDVDATQLRSAMLIDGKISAHPLGIADVGANTVLWEWLKEIMFQTTGINPQGLTGDGLKTAFQSGLLVRQMNMRAKDRITAWEGGCLQRAWVLLLDYALSDSTIEDWTKITEKEAEEIVRMIGDDDMAGSDFNKKTKEKRTLRYFPVPGYNFKEDFKGKQSKKRQLKKGATNNTLIGGKSKDGDVAMVPMDAAYLLPAKSVEGLVEFDVRVSGKNMLFDLKTQDIQTAKEFIGLGTSIAPAVPGIDFRKQYIAAGIIAGFEEEDLMKSEGQKSDLLKQVEAALGEEGSIETLPAPIDAAEAPEPSLLENLASGQS